MEFFFFLKKKAFYPIIQNFWKLFLRNRRKRMNLFFEAEEKKKTFESFEKVFQVSYTMGK